MDTKFFLENLILKEVFKKNKITYFQDDSEMLDLYTVELPVDEEWLRTPLAAYRLADGTTIYKNGCVLSLRR